MSLSRPLVLWLLAVAPLDAFAQQPPAPFPAAGVVRFLPAGEIDGDAATPVQLEVFAVTTDGAPMTGLKPKVTASAGAVVGWTEVGGGFYTCQYTPPKADAPMTVSLKLRGKNGTTDVSVDDTLAIRPPPGHQATVTSNPDTVTLGADSGSTVTVTLQGNPLPGTDLAALASSGAVANITDIGGGKFSARFTAPTVDYPHLAILTFADRRDPSHTYADVVVPMQGKTDYPVKGPPNASVLLKIGGREFGPVPVGADGTAKVPVVVPPGVEKATQVTVDAGQSHEETIDLRIPETKRLELFPLEKGIPSDASLKVPVRVAVRVPTGAPDNAAKVAFTATAGTFGAARLEGDGVYEADYTPPAGNTASTATITVALTGSTTQTDTQDIALVPVRPDSLALTSEPTSLDKDSNAFKVFAKVVGPDGKGLGGRDLSFTPTGATAKGAVQDLKNGDYRADFSTTGTASPADVLATVATAPTGNPLRTVLVFPVRSSIPADGVSSDMLTVVTVDEFGYPVANVPVTLKVDGGDGSVPASATTNANGLAQVFYTAGRTGGMPRVSVTAGDHSGGVVLLQGPVLLQGVLPTSGTSAQRGLAQKWSQIVASLHLDRTGVPTAVSPPPSPPPAAPAPAQTVAPPAVHVAAITAKAEPATASAGSDVTLKINAIDESGHGAAGVLIDVITSIGKAATVTDQGGGNYQAILQVPADATGEAKISVATDDGAASYFLKLPIGPAGPKTAPVTPPPTTPPAATIGTTNPPPTTPIAPKPPPAYPWIRTGVGYVLSSYQYLQTPNKDPGPLLAQPFAIGGKAGSNAVPMGFQLTARGYVPQVKYLGFDANVRAAFFSISAPAFGAQHAPDWVVDVRAEPIGRRPFTVGQSVLHIGVRAGFHYSDVETFRGCLQKGCTVEYAKVGLPGFGVGGEFGADVGRFYFDLGAEKQFYAATPVATDVDAQIGAGLGKYVYGELGFGYVNRTVSLVGQTSGTTFGTVADQQFLGTISLGMQL